MGTKNGSKVGWVLGVHLEGIGGEGVGMGKTHCIGFFNEQIIERKFPSVSSSS